MGELARSQNNRGGGYCKVKKILKNIMFNHKIFDILYQRLVPVVTEWDPDGADGDNLTIMFKLVASALKIRDSDLNEAMEALGEKEAGSEFKEENRKLRKEIKDLKKENKELDKSLKRVQKIKSEGGGDEALEVVMVTC